MSLVGRPAWLRTMTGRLVVIAVALVAVVSLGIGTATALVMRSSLLDRLDQQVHDLADRAGRGPDGQAAMAPDTLLVAVPDRGREAVGGFAGEEFGDSEPLTPAALRALELSGAGPGEDPVTVDLPGAGGYRIIRTDALLDGSRVRLYLGLPTDEVDATMRNLVLLEVALTLLGVAVAAGAGTVIVRRELRSLRQVGATADAVSALPLDRGAVEVAPRVPGRIAGEQTEVGHVGAALNTLLDHVEGALAARHRSEQQVRRFVADASHELRTPLTTIRGYTELARSRPEDRSATSTAVQKVHEESARMTTMVEDLLLLARLDQGRPLEREPVDLTKLLLEAVADARVVDDERDWQLRLAPELEPAESVVTVTGDATRLHQVVSNLLTNARRYTHAGTTVTVTVRAGGFSVHDDGPGFAPDVVDRAFDRFARGDAARGRGGTGLGLAIVRAIVTAHGGSVALDSRPGDTTVTVGLPTARAGSGALRAN